ncbi:hypothetical protein NM208_g16629 [Fusarium decemcellulare]|uniref:Uncharacterized protein n=1 Tax=Fusarium decemcellulare TaxID=57161 RepID=A0ACC1RBD7_9HYPO|nr:hypothetical protein NM208_g16629 [Fusarium decemcellulare]
MDVGPSLIGPLDAISALAEFHSNRPSWCIIVKVTIVSRSAASGRSWAFPGLGRPVWKMKPRERAMRPGSKTRCKGKQTPQPTSKSFKSWHLRFAALLVSAPSPGNTLGLSQTESTGLAMAIYLPFAVQIGRPYLSPISAIIITR